MSAGDLGTVPKEVELALERALTLCGLWNAMLLLDEADMFLGARTDSDLARNELVAGKNHNFLLFLYAHANKHSIPHQARVLHRSLLPHDQSNSQHRHSLPVPRGSLPSIQGLDI